ncbi:GNAT family N-acetyltransferase [Citreimonas salinaria]|uniref:Ribosomal protein S18 acetylase RimI n=1 Tax=Citreimonas salinaria TaxID=321339 RepID=A0A1H3L3Q9_9RHOB|nr:N-acetyltransferase [Citreimonas salinaria]SDY58849.1 Ribosomal protein S18 acetylase RimI [Citreimonas salinaria]
MQSLTLRPYAPADASAVTDMLMPVFREGATYAIDRDIAPDAALAYWTGGGRAVFVAKEAGRPLGTYYLVRNQGGGGAHVCNAGFVTAVQAQGRGVARAMLDHALAEARARGFAAMQFNFVIETNARAVALWQRAGFEIVGRLSRAFLHPDAGAVDALVMFRAL